jgi:DNA-binding MarR family transcriptional regulator
LSFLQAGGETMNYDDLASEMLRKTGAMMKTSFWPKKANAFMHGEMFILNYLIFRETDVLPGELSAAMNTSTARVAMALKSLESKGLIQRRVDQEDRRKILVTITDLGRELIRSERREMRDKKAVQLRDFVIPEKIGVVM